MLLYAFRDMVCRFATQYFYISHHCGKGGLKRLGLMLLLLASLTLILNIAPRVHAASFELAYDDGEFDYGWSDFYPSGAAVRFSPPSQSWRITGIRLHGVCVLRGSQVFYVEIWDSNLNTKYRSVFLLNDVFKNATLDWHTIRLPNVVVTGDFYVVIVPMFTLDGPQLWISVDNDPPVSNNSFIVDLNTHAVLASLNATSRRPGDFMVRVMGEPIPTPPELRLSSISVGEEETTVVFTYPGEVRSVGARLVKLDGSFREQNVTKDGQSLTVRVREEGVLNVFVVTPSYEIIGASVRLETGLRSLYKSLLANYTVLEAGADELRRRLNSLAEENENLRTQVRDSNYAINILQNQVWELIENNTRLEQQVAELNRSIERLRLENDGLRREENVLLILLSVAVAVPLLVFVRKLRVRK